MKNSIVAFISVMIAATSWAQENRLPQQEAQRYAKLCVDHTGNPFAGQITTHLDPKKACATLGEGGGAMVVADKKLSQKSLLNAGKKIIPVGQLWLRKWTLVIDNKAVAKEKLNMVTVHIDDKDRPMPLFLLGLQKRGAKDWQLLVYAKDQKPLQTLPLKNINLIQELPVEIEWFRGEKQTDPLTITILGKLQGELKITRQGG